MVILDSLESVLKLIVTVNLSKEILVTKYIQQFVDKETVWNEDYIPTYFTLDDLEVSLNFTLISEGLLLNEKSYADAIALKVKLQYS